MKTAEALTAVGLIVAACELGVITGSHWAALLVGCIAYAIIDFHARHTGGA